MKPHAMQGVLRYRNAKSAFAVQARTFATLVQAMTNVEVPSIYPSAVADTIALVGDEARANIDEQVAQTVREVLEHNSAPFQCLGVVRDVLGLRLAKTRNIDGEFVAESEGQLSALKDERIGACVDVGRAEDATLAPYTPGEFNL